MLTLRCTKKLLTRLKVKPDLQPPPSTTKLGDWYADVLNMGRERLVLCVSERALLPVIVPAAGADLDVKLSRGLRETLEALHVPEATIDAEVSELVGVTIAKTASRVVLGSMNEFQFMVRHVRNGRPTASPLELGLELAEVLCGALDYEPPGEAAVAMLTGNPGRPKAKLKLAPPPPPSSPRRRAMTNAEYEEMVEAATVDASGESEQAIGWHCAIDEHLRTPFETEMLGVTVRVEKIELGDDDSIVAVCRRGSHRQTVPILDLPLPAPPPEGAAWVEAYRRWRRWSRSPRGSGIPTNEG